VKAAITVNFASPPPSQPSRRKHSAHRKNRDDSRVMESAPNVIVELDEKNEIMGLEIWNAKKSGLLEEVAKVAAGS
jgi:uncharacterized protein YuzE